MLSLRGDVGGMKAIIKAYNRWIPYNSHIPESEAVGMFANQWLDARYSAPIGPQEKREIMRLLADIAFPEYCAEINSDGTPSLLALLGAVSEAERVIVDPTIVARKCQKLFQGNISGKTLGGVGIADISIAFSNGARRFQQARADLEKRYM